VIAIAYIVLANLVKKGSNSAAAAVRPPTEPATNSRESEERATRSLRRL